jgi:hypothetical protein
LTVVSQPTKVFEAPVEKYTQAFTASQQVIMWPSQQMRLRANLLFDSQVGAQA